MHLINPLTTNDDCSRHRNSAACYQLVQSALLAERVGQGGGGWVSPRRLQCMAAVAAGCRLCRKALFNARWAIVLLSCTNRPRKHSFLLCMGSTSDILVSFQSGGALSGRRALTIERLLMSVCDQGNELVKDMWKKLWLKHSRSGSTGEKRCD